MDEEYWNWVHMSEREDEVDRTDSGMLIVTYEKDGTVTVRARSPGEIIESKVNLPLANWRALIAETSQPS